MKNNKVISFTALILVCLAIVVSVVSCQKMEYEELLPADISTRLNYELVRTNVTSIQEENLEFEVDFVVLNSLGNPVTLKEEHIDIELNLFESISLDPQLLSLECAKGFPKDNLEAPYSISLLIDQSGSVMSSDSLNLRVEAGKNLVAVAGSDDEISVSVFSGAYPSPSMTLIQDYTTNDDSLNTALNSIIGKTGNSTPLFQSLYENVTYVINNAKYDNKAIIILTDEGASDQSAQVDSLLCLARFNTVKIHSVSFQNNAYNNAQLADLVVGSNGVVMNVEQAIGIPSVQSLMNNEYASNELYDFFYRTKWTTQKPFPSAWEIGDIMRGNIKIYLGEGLSTVVVPFRLLIC